MRWMNLLGILVMSLAVGVWGCSKGDDLADLDHDHDHDHAHHDHDHANHKHSSPDEIKARLAKLSDEDRTLALAQGNCVVDTDHQLGCMDVPYKLMIDGRAVFLCCEHCKDKAMKDTKATLATLDDLLKKNKK